MPELSTVLLCIDESVSPSGVSPDNKITAIGAVGLASHELEPFGSAWQKRLAVDDIRYFSMGDAMSFRNEFRKWKNSEEGTLKRNSLVTDFADMLISTRVRAYTSTLDVEFNSKSPKQKARFFDNPHYALFEACVRKVLSACVDVNLQLMVDQSDSYSEKVLACYRRILETDAKARLCGICFCDDEINPLLQASDLMAYIARAFVAHESDELHDPLIPVLLDKFSAVTDREVEPEYL